MTFHIKKLGVKLGIWIMQGLIALKKGLTFLFFIFFFPFRFLGRCTWSIVGRPLLLLCARLAHMIRMQKTIASHPLAILFIFLLSIAIVYKIAIPQNATSSSELRRANESIELATLTNAVRNNDSFLPQVLEALPSIPGESEDIMPSPTIAGGNALIAPTMNATRLESRLREEPEQYLVQEGDTLSDIAEQFGISIATILWENKLTLRSIIRPGMGLTILPVSGLSHVVQRRETIASIAKRYKVEERTILDFNEIAEAGNIALGQRLIIPEGEPVIAPTRPRTPIAQTPRTSPSKITPSGLRLLVPVIYRRISQWFTYRHSGIDMAGAYGTPVKAAKGGVVVQSGWGTGYGLYVLIDHGGGLMTRYAHNAKNLVSRGETVTQGQTISLLGSTGRSTGPHVHFETIVNGQFVNPLRYITL